MDWLELGFLGLFLGTFIASTLIPLPSEGILIGFYLADFPVITCLILATAGNFLGGLTNYLIGYLGHSERMVKWFKLDEERLHKWEQRFNKWGVFLGLLSWVPFIGDPMVVALGFFRVNFWKLSLMMLIGKFARYFVLTLPFLD